MMRVFCVFLVGLLSVSVHGDDCPYKECYCGGIYIMCISKSLTAMPERISDSNTAFTDLNMDDNQIGSVPAGSLPPHLRLLAWTYNPIETIDDSAFDESLDTLQTLIFSGARFTKLPKAVLKLQGLVSLSISNTDIVEWDEDGMKKLGAKMQEFELDSVGLTSWPTWLQSFTNMTMLTVSGNSLSDIPDDALDMVTNVITDVTLINNSLTTVPKTLSKMTALKRLNLKNNRITDVTYIPQLTKLFIIALDSNRIWNATSLSNAVRFHADTMFSFGIQDNYLTSIPELNFLQRIYSLDFSNNHISDPISGSISSVVNDLTLNYNYLPFIPRILKSLQSVTDLVLTNNHISSIQGPDFPITTTGANLGYNMITQLTDTSFPRHSNITYLLLNFNPLSTISILAFQNLPRLTYLNIQHSKLTRIPLAIASLTNLDLIDVSGSPDLVCTCMERSLEDRIKSMMPDNVSGDCGQTSLYNFFNELILDCPQIS